MFQIINSVMTTCMRYGEEYLPWAVAIIVVLTIGGIALRVLKRR